MELFMYVVVIQKGVCSPSEGLTMMMMMVSGLQTILAQLGERRRQQVVVLPGGGKGGSMSTRRMSEMNGRRGHNWSPMSGIFGPSEKDLFYFSDVICFA